MKFHEIYEDDGDLTLLDFVAFNGLQVALEYLVKSSSKQARERALFYALYGCNRNSVDYLRTEYKVTFTNKLNYTSYNILQALMNQGDVKIWDLYRTLYHDVSGIDINEASAHGTTALMLATRWCYEYVEWLINNGANVNLKDRDGRYAIHYLCDSNKCNINVINLLIERGIDINVTDNGGTTPLMLAATYSSYEVVKWLLDHGARVDIRDKNNRNALHYITYNNNNVDSTRLLIERGIDINVADNEGTTPLMLAAKYSSYNALALLLDHGASVNIRDKNNRNALHYITYNNKNVNSTRLLIERGIDINAANNKGKTPLMLASGEWSSYKTVQLLLDHGANLDCIDTDGNNALHYICEKYDHNLDAIELLIKKGIDINATNNKGTTPLMLVAYKSSVNAMKLLLDYGASVNCTDQNGRNALHYVCDREENKFDTVELLIDRGIDMNLTDKEGNTPLTLAKRQAAFYKDIIEFLKEFDSSVLAKTLNNIFETQIDESEMLNKLKPFFIMSNINIKTHKKETVLMVAAKLGYSQLWGKILKYQPDLNCRNVYGDTALHCVFFDSSQHCKLENEIVKFLKNILPSLPDLNITNIFGETILMVAVSLNLPEVTSLLLEHKADISALNHDNKTVLDIAENMLQKDPNNENRKTTTKQLLLYFTTNNKTQETSLLGHDLILDSFEAGRSQKQILQLLKIFLLLPNTEINERNHEGDTILMLAAKLGYDIVWLYLLQCCADLTCLNMYGDSALHCIFYDRNQHFKPEEKVLKFLKNVNIFSININVKNYYGETILQKAVMLDYHDVKKFLIELGADSVNSGTVGSNLAVETETEEHSLSNRDTNLHFSCLNKDNRPRPEQEVVPLLEHLLSMPSVGINMTNNNGQTVLMLLIQLGYVDALGLVLKRNPEWSCKDKDGNTALHLVYFNYDKSIKKEDKVLRLLQLVPESCLKTIINIQNKKAETMLMLAGQLSHLNVWKFLLRNNPDMDCVNNEGNTALHCLVMSSDLKPRPAKQKYVSDTFISMSKGHDHKEYIQDTNDLFKDLFQPLSKTNLKINTHNGRTVLIILTLTNNIDVLNYLLESIKNIDLNEQDFSGYSVIHHAFFDLKGHWKKEENILILLKIFSNANISLQTNDGTTALMLAATLGSTEITKYLLNKEANVNEVDKIGCTALHWALRHSCEDMDEKVTLTLVETLLTQSDVDLNKKNHNGRTVLMEAVLFRCFKVVEYLLNQDKPIGIDLNEEDNYGNTILHLAFFFFPGVWKKENETLKLLKLILKKTENILDNKNNKGFTVLMYAAMLNFDEVFVFLLENNADCNVVNQEGNTALHLIFDDPEEGWKSEKQISFFLNKILPKLNIDIINKHRGTLLELADNLGCESCNQLL